MLKNRFLIMGPAIFLFFVPRVSAQLSLMMNPMRYLMPSVHENMCMDYLHDTTGHDDILFKSVTEINYNSSDSLLEHKKLVSKKITRFNKRGQVISYIKSDTVGKVTDSVVTAYDEAFRPMSVKEYSFNDDKGKLTLQTEVNDIYNEKGNCIKMQSWSCRSYGYNTKYLNNINNGSDTDFETAVYNYNEKDKPIKAYIIDSKNDTTTLQFTYYPDNKIESMKGQIKTKKDGKTNINKYRMGFFSSDTYLYKFDENGNTIQTLMMDGNDTLKNEYSTYDDEMRETSQITFNKGKIVRREKIVYGQDREKTKTIEEIGTSETKGSYDNLFGTSYRDKELNQASCTINTKTVDVYNNFGDLDSNKVTTTGVGKPSIKTTSHHYKYNYFGKKLSDSEMVVEQSEYHASGTLSVYYYTYDNWGNMIEMASKGGEGTASDARYTYTYNKQNYLLTESDYGSCLDTPYATYKLTYFTDGITEKELETSRGNNHYTYRYGEDTRKLESISSTSYGIEQTIYEYENR